MLYANVTSLITLMLCCAWLVKTENKKWIKLLWCKRQRLLNCKNVIFKVNKTDYWSMFYKKIQFVFLLQDFTCYLQFVNLVKLHLKSKQYCFGDVVQKADSKV